MKAVILAGGKGTGLFPLSAGTPKPMLEIMNRPCISYVAELMYLNGIEECAVTVGYKGEELEDFLKKEPSDMKITAFSESTPLGSAGSVKNCGSFFEDDFLVIGGDCICDFDFSEAIAAHKRTNALATVITAKGKPSLCHSFVYSDKNKKIVRLFEKPGWEQVGVGRVNTGICIFKKEILEYIPEGEYDISSQLLPLLLENGLPLYEYPLEGYWRDINTLEDYTKCNFDMLSGKMDIIPRPVRRGRHFFKTAAPVFVGRGVNADPLSLIGPNAIVGDGCYIGKNAVLKNCIVGKNAVIGDGAVVCGIVGDNAVLRPGCSIASGAVVGKGCVIGRNAVIGKNAHIYPGREVGDNFEITVSVLDENMGKGIFGERSVEGDLSCVMTPLFAGRLGAALGECFKGDIIVGFSKPQTRLFAGSLCAATAAKGAKVIKCDCSINELRFACAKNSCIGVYVHGEEKRLRTFIFGNDGRPVSYALERKIEAAFYKDNGSFAAFDEQKEIDVLQGTDKVYCRKLCEVMGKISANVLIYGESELCKLLRRCVNRCGGGLSDALELEFNENGTELRITHNGLTLDTHTLMAIACLFEEEKVLPLPQDMPLFLLDRIGVTARTANGNAYEEYPYFFDSLFLAARLLNIMEREGKELNELYMLLPRFGFANGRVQGKGAVIGRLKELIPAADISGQGIRITADEGVISIIPLRRSEGFKVLAYSRDTETSKELCEDMCDILKNLTYNEY